MRHLKICLFVFSVFCCVFLCSCNGTPDWLKNYDTTIDFHINNTNQFIELTSFINSGKGNFENKKIILDSDIVFNENCQAYEGGMTGASITDSIDEFAGEFDGAGHTISGVCNENGLFKSIIGNSSIHDLSFSNSYINNYAQNSPVGMVATINQGKQIKLSNININDGVYINTINCAGGIIGKIEDSANVNVDKCKFNGYAASSYRSTEVDKKTNKIKFESFTGGIIGHSGNSNVTITNCEARGKIIGGTNCSGILGSGSGQINITKCVDIAELKCGSVNYGYRLFGGPGNANISDCTYLEAAKQGNLFNASYEPSNIKIDNKDDYNPIYVDNKITVENQKFTFNIYLNKKFGSKIKATTTAPGEITQIGEPKQDGNWIIFSFSTGQVQKSDFHKNYEFYASVEEKGINSEHISTTFDICVRAMLNDLRSDDDSCYKYQVSEEPFKYQFSPYTTEQRAQLNSYLENKITEDTPESVGLSSQKILEMYKEMERRGLATHTCMISRNGKVVDEKYADGYEPEDLQRMYSVSKSVVGISMDMLVHDSNYQVSLDDPVGKYFPEYPNADATVKNTTIRQLMQMSSPFKHCPYEVGNKEHTNWIEKFFTTTPEKNPSDYKYYYDTCGCYIVDVIVERVTGMYFMDYAKSKGLQLDEKAWCVNAPEGYPWGGSGCMITTRNLHELGRFVMSNGRNDGNKVINYDYKEILNGQYIDNSAEGYGDFNGRGYKDFIWITDNGFAYHGMGNQVTICMPKQNLIFTITSDNQGNGAGYFDIHELVDKYLLSSLDNYAENQNALKQLRDYKLKLPTQKGNNSSPKINEVKNKSFKTQASDKISEFKLDFDNEKLIYTCHGETDKTIDFKICENKFGNLDELSYSWKTINKPMTEDNRNDGYRTAASGAWTDDNTFVIYVQVIDDYLANMKMTFKFDGDKCYLTNTYTAEGFLTEYKMTNVEFN